MGSLACAPADARRAASKRNPAPIDRAIEDPCFIVEGWPLFADEINDVAAIVGCAKSALRRTVATPLSVWRRFGGPLPQLERSLDLRLVVGLIQSGMRGLIDRVEPAAWIAKDGKAPFVYGSKHMLDSSNNTRKGGMRTAHFIGEDAFDADRVGDRFVAQCIQDFCADGSGVRCRLGVAHGYERLEIAHNGPSQKARLPEHDDCHPGCDLCNDEFASDGNERTPTTWRKLLHRAERFLVEWELVRVDARPGGVWEWDGADIRPSDLDGWPLGEWP